MAKVAIVDKFNRGTDYSRYFNFEFDEYHLSSKNKKKLLKADKDIQIDTEAYDYIILVGAEATKHFTKNISVTSHNGFMVEDKFIPIIDPSMLVFKPDMQSSFDKAVQNITDIVNGIKKEARERNAYGIEDEDEAIAVLSQILNLDSSLVSLDTETSALYPRDGILLGVSISAGEDEGFYISSDCFLDEATYLLQEIVNKHTIVFHNAKFDIKFLSYHLGIDFGIKDLYSLSYHDTMLEHYVLDETQGSHGLKDLCIKYTDLGDYDRELDQFKRNYCRTHKIKLADFTYDLIPFETMYPYAAKDTMGTLELHNKFYPHIKGNKIATAYDLIRRGTNLLIHMEEVGVPFDKAELEKAKTELTEQIFNLEQEIYSYPEISQLEENINVKFNINSVIHLRYLFFTLLKLPDPGKRTETGAISVDAEVLKELSKHHPIVKSIAELKKVKKILSTYIIKVLDNLDSDGRLRTGFNLTTTTSGRLSSSGKLNMQQLPRDNKIVKKCIKAPEGYVVVSQDLATAEMYVAAVLSGDKNLQKVFIDKQNGKGADFHSTIAHMVFHLPCDVTEVKKLFPHFRQAAKAISFGILYGSGPQKVADTVNAEGDGSFTLEDAKDAIRKYFSKFPKLEQWLKKNQEFIKKNGYIYSIFGRKRRLKNVFSKDRQTQGHELRSGINFLIQSVASDINLLGAIDLQQYINRNGIKAEIFALVHDSILAIVAEEDLDEYLYTAKRIIQQDYGCSIPGCPIGIDQEVGKDYSFQKYEN